MILGSGDRSSGDQGPSAGVESVISLDAALIAKAAEIAREAGARLREFYAQGVETEYKGDVDLVTVADRTVEKLIRARLGEAFPEHGIYGEEGTRERMEGEFRWYVDPLDGTTNFAHGFPQFCVSMGLEHRPAGLNAGARWNAGGGGDLRSDARRAVHGGTRQGARLNGKPMQVSRTRGAGRGAAGDGVSEPQAPREPQHSLLPGVHAALARGAAGGFGGAGSGVCGLRAAGRFLGVQSESVGHGGRNPAGGGGRRAGDGLCGTGFSSWTAGRRWPRMG